MKYSIYHTHQNGQYIFKTTKKKTIIKTGKGMIKLQLWITSANVKKTQPL